MEKEPPREQKTLQMSAQKDFRMLLLCDYVSPIFPLSKWECLLQYPLLVQLLRIGWVGVGQVTPCTKVLMDLTQLLLHITEKLDLEINMLNNWYLGLSPVTIFF